MENDVVIANTEDYTDDDLMTVRQYADWRGCTDRAVYKRISTGKLNDYLVVRGNNKLLLRKLLDDEAKERQKNRFNPLSTSTQLSTVDNSKELVEELVERMDRIEKKVDALTALIMEQNKRTPEINGKEEQVDNGGQGIDNGRNNEKVSFWKKFFGK